MKTKTFTITLPKYHYSGAKKIRLKKTKGVVFAVLVGGKNSGKKFSADDNIPFADQSHPLAWFVEKAKATVASAVKGSGRFNNALYEEFMGDLDGNKVAPNPATTRV